MYGCRSLVQRVDWDTRNRPALRHGATRGTPLQSQCPPYIIFLPIQRRAIPPCDTVSTKCNPDGGQAHVSPAIGPRPRHPQLARGFEATALASTCGQRAAQSPRYIAQIVPSAALRVSPTGPGALAAEGYCGRCFQRCTLLILDITIT